MTEGSILTLLVIRSHKAGRWSLAKLSHYENRVHGLAHNKQWSDAKLRAAEIERTPKGNESGDWLIVCQSHCLQKGG